MARLRSLAHSESLFLRTVLWVLCLDGPGRMPFLQGAKPARPVLDPLDQGILDA